VVRTGATHAVASLRRDDCFFLLVGACSTGQTSLVQIDAKSAASDVARYRDAAVNTDGGPEIANTEVSGPDLGSLDVRVGDSGVADKDTSNAVADVAPAGDLIDLVDASTADLPVAGCAGAFSGGLLYSDLTLTKACSPYVIQSTVVVYPGATLTVEPATVLLFGRGNSLDVQGGRLDARGTQSDPIVFDAYSANPSPGDWYDLEFGIHPTCPTSQLRFVTIRNCGAAPAASGCVYISNLPSTKVVELDAVTISRSAGHGVIAWGIADFSIKNSTFRDIPKEAFAVSLPATQFNAIGSGNDFGGAAVNIKGGTLSGNTSWSAPGTDIVVTGSISTGWVVEPMLFSLGPGMKFLFARNTGILVDGLTRFAVRGTADAPVVFSSLASTPKPGDWAGITVVGGGDVRAINASYAVIEFAGGGDTGPRGGLFLNGPLVEAVITDSVIRQNAGQGIYLSCGAQTLPVLSGTTFEANASDIHQTGAIADNVGPGPSSTDVCVAP
jgi:hypothetical protein